MKSKSLLNKTRTNGQRWLRFDLQLQEFAASRFLQTTKRKQQRKQLALIGVENELIGTHRNDEVMGGNITGVTTLSRELSGKRLELLKEVIPRMSRVGVLSGNPESGCSYT